MAPLCLCPFGANLSPCIKHPEEPTSHGWRVHGSVIVARLGLLLLALLLHMQIYSNQTAVVTLSRNSSQSTSAAPNSTNATHKAAGRALQSIASLLVISLYLLHLYC